MNLPNTSMGIGQSILFEKSRAVQERVNRLRAGTSPDAQYDPEDRCTYYASGHQPVYQDTNYFICEDGIIELK